MQDFAHPGKLTKFRYALAIHLSPGRYGECRFQALHTAAKADATNLVLVLGNVDPEAFSRFHNPVPWVIRSQQARSSSISLVSARSFFSTSILDLGRS